MPTYALSRAASAAFTDWIIVLNVTVSASTSRLSPPGVSTPSNSRDSVMPDSDADSESIGRAIVRDSQTLASAASANAPSAIQPIVRSAPCITGRCRRVDRVEHVHLRVSLVEEKLHGVLRISERQALLTHIRANHLGLERHPGQGRGDDTIVGQDHRLGLRHAWRCLRRSA